MLNVKALWSALESVSLNKLYIAIRFSLSFESIAERIQIVFYEFVSYYILMIIFK